MNNNAPVHKNKPFSATWANVPFVPARWPFFYGWTIVCVSTLSIIGSIPGQTAGVGVFTDYIIDALGVTRNQLSVAYMVGTIISGLILPFAGKLLDRIGVRFMSVFASVGLAISLILLATIGTWTRYLASWISLGLLPVITTSFAFLLIRFFGQGNMTMVGRVAMGKWFNHWRGMATAIAGVPIAFVFNAAPWIMNTLINAFGWQRACWILAAIVGGGMSVIGIIFFRDTPEECGLLMDGKTPGTFDENPKPELHPVHHQFTRGQAVRTLSFWAYALGLAAHGLIVTAVAFHITSIGAEMGKTRDQAVMMFFYSSFLSIPTRFIVSYFVDNTRLRLKWMLILMAVTMVLYTYGLTILNTRLGWWLTIVMFGITGGLWGVLGNVPMPRYFGRQHLGAISGLMMSVLVIASALGPAMFSFSRQYLGSYRNAAYVVLLLPVMIVVLSCFTRNPQRKYADSSETHQKPSSK